MICDPRYLPPPVNDTPPESRAGEARRQLHRLHYTEVARRHYAALDVEDTYEAEYYGDELDRRHAREHRRTHGNKTPGRIVQAVNEWRWPSPLEEQDIIGKSNRLLWLFYQCAISKGDRHAVGVILAVARRRGLPWANGNTGRGGAG